MDLSGQPHAPVALVPRKQPVVSRICGCISPRASVDFLKKEKFFPAGIRTPDYPTSSVLTTLATLIKIVLPNCKTFGMLKFKFLESCFLGWNVV
jgi:hypothetical protein